MTYDKYIHFEDNIFKKAWASFLQTIKWFHLISNNLVEHKYNLLFTHN